MIDHGRILLNASDGAHILQERGQFGTLLSDGRLQLSVFEAMYLLDQEKIFLFSTRGRTYTPANLLRAAPSGRHFWTKYAVYKDLRDRGYVVKTALKFGADFRVYDRGTKVGQTHAKWAVFAVQEHDLSTWEQFSGKNRVAHSTKKRLLIGIVDDDLDVCYWEARWLRP